MPDLAQTGSESQLKLQDRLPIIRVCKTFRSSFRRPAKANLGALASI